MRNTTASVSHLTRTTRWDANKAFLVVYFGAVFFAGMLFEYNSSLIRSVVDGSEFERNEPVRVTAKDTNKKEVIVLTKTREPCQKKFLLLTTQRSGSTWTCSLLHQQKGVSCGGRQGVLGPISELLIHYSYKKKAFPKVTWQEYQRDLDKAFAEACHEHRETSIGFKLMYDQIPPQFLEDGKLKHYLKENNVSLIHLVREAKILVLASKADVGKRTANHQTKHHTTNATKAKELREQGIKFQWNNGTIHDMLKLEDISIKWQAIVHRMAPLVRYYYVSYESLLAAEERDFLVGQLVGFLTHTGHDSSIHGAQGNLMQLSNSSCSDRLINYEKFRAHVNIQNSRSADACDLLETITNNNN